MSNVLSPVFSELVAGDSLACDNAAPLVLVESASAEITESATGTITATATDRNGQTLTYAWTQVSGSAATLTGTDTATLSFTPAAITADEELVFEVAVSDGVTTVTQQSTVMVKNEAVATVPVTESKSSGGGSFGFIALLLTPLVLFNRRRKSVSK
ncbi:GlyGly-CTERM sorting domain-containing protein [Pseudoalteromonas sp. B193]